MSGGRITDVLIMIGYGEFKPGTTDATQLPDRPCAGVVFQAPEGNTSPIAIGRSSAVTAPAGATNVTAGYVLSPDRESMFFLVGKSLSDFWIKLGTDTDVLYYTIFGHPSPT